MVSVYYLFDNEQSFMHKPTANNKISLIMRKITTNLTFYNNNNKNDNNRRRTNHPKIIKVFFHPIHGKTPNDCSFCWKHDEMENAFLFAISLFIVLPWIFNAEKKSFRHPTPYSFHLLFIAPDSQGRQLK